MVLTCSTNKQATPDVMFYLVILGFKVKPEQIQFQNEYGTITFRNTND